MGARLMTEALAAGRWCAMVEGAPLTNNAWRVLVVMAHRSLDNEGKNGQPGRVYYGGWEVLALEALDYREWTRNNAANRTVARAISELQDRGLIRPHKVPGRRGMEYEVLPPNGPRTAYTA